MSKFAGMERTYIMIKPDGVQRGLIGQIVARFEAKGYVTLLDTFSKRGLFTSMAAPLD